jgi:hypothetical protein
MDRSDENVLIGYPEYLVFCGIRSFATEGIIVSAIVGSFGALTILGVTRGLPPENPVSEFVKARFLSNRFHAISNFHTNLLNIMNGDKA